MADAYHYEHGRVFLPHQFSNLANPEAHYLTTGPEIWLQLEKLGFKPEAFVAGVGTAGTVMGVAAYFCDRDPNIKVYPLEPAESPTLTTGYQSGNHRIQGISDEFVPAICDLAKLHDVISISDGDAILMAQKLAAELGLGVGISSGANFLGALTVFEKLDPEAIVTTVFADDNKKYLSTDLFKPEPVKSGYLSPDVKLFGYQTLPRIDSEMAIGFS